MLNAGMMSSNRDDWETPWDLFNSLNAEFGFTLDACAEPSNAKCKHYLTKQDDAFSRKWQGVVWMNPPYGKPIGKWLQKAYSESLYGATVVCLVPARTDTEWWHDWCVRGEVRLLKGRVRFVGAKATAPFPSAVVVFKRCAEGSDARGRESG